MARGKIFLVQASISTSARGPFVISSE